MKIPFEIKRHQDIKAIFINNELFDWAIEDQALEQANEFASNPNALKAIHTDIQNYFLECLEEYLGFKVTMKEVNNALKTGHIDDRNTGKR